MNYYVISPNIYNDGDNYADEMFNKGVAAVGWGADDKKKKGVQFKSIKVGDCIIVALRSDWIWKYYYIGIVVEDEKNPSCGTQSKKLSPIIRLNEQSGLDLNKWTANGSKQIPSPQRIDENKGDNREIIKQINMIINMSKYKGLLESNKNLILTGAPGTGKTYLTRQIAAQMILGHEYNENDPDDKKKMEEQMGFVQFHPSYDYTDFVEGLRPFNDNGKVGFKRKDGTFKAFCKRALQGNKSNGQDNFEEAWKKLVSHLNDNDYIDIPLLSKKRNIKVELNGFGDGLVERTYDKEDNDNWIRGKSKFFNKEQLYKVYMGLPGIPSGGHDNYRQAIVQYMKDELDLKEYKAPQKNDSEKADPYVFIIDEINRGEISKIFGELFFSIDPGYRGEDGKVKTQYQNLIDKEDIFYDGFYVPKNVYIIGTMNDIDRSVESMDFAFRRRFAFKEIKATDRVEMLWDSKKGIPNQASEAEQKMNSLNDAIEKIEGLSTAYHIGPAYFLKLKNYLNEENPWESLWNNHLEGLLHEYLRGMNDVEVKMKALKNAYDNDNDKANNDEPASDNGQQ